jgi:hypothetical protein
MSSARHQLLLLGLVCQGLSWDNFVVPLLYALLWAACLRLPRRPARFGQFADISAIILGGVLAWQLAPMFGASAHFAVGHGLALLQLLRLLRPLDRREKLFSLIVAVGHLAVACTVILDYRFILILGAALVLLPRALMELELESAAANAVSPGPLPRLGLVTATAIFAVMVAVFVLVPRGFLGTPFAARLPGGSPGGGLDDVLDPSRSGQANASKLLLQIEANEVGYLRAMVMPDYADGRWRADTGSPWVALGGGPATRLPNLRHRRVRVKDVAALNRVLPTDGVPVRVTGRFFRAAGRNSHGLIGSDVMWNSGNNLYEYWVHPRPPAELLRGWQRERLLARPEPSPQLRAWINEVLAGVTEPHAQARRLEAHLRDTFAYELGAPELGRLNALEDFLLKERRGHCERFASALALLLRMQGIPARVVVGFVPGERNWLSGWRDVRLRDAHAWVEAHFVERGWVTLDATPRATLPPPGWAPAELLDALDVIWYLNIVNFDSAAQRGLAQATSQGLGAAMELGRRFGPALVGIAVVGALAWRLRRWRWPAGTHAPSDAAAASTRFASHSYGRMLRALAARGLHRRAHDTPQEFLASVQERAPEVSEPVARVTNAFCATRYGGVVLTEAERDDVERAVAEVGKAVKEQALAAR